MENFHLLLRGSWVNCEECGARGWLLPFRWGEKNEYLEWAVQDACDHIKARLYTEEPVLTWRLGEFLFSVVPRYYAVQWDTFVMPIPVGKWHLPIIEASWSDKGIWVVRYGRLLFVGIKGDDGVITLLPEDGAEVDYCKAKRLWRV
ncbi:MAG: hypothetical protein QXS40_05495 [Candidatus Nitrosocaldus sp.]